MAKLNFSKIEQDIDAHILKISVDNLLKLADLAASMGGSVKKIKGMQKTFQKSLKNFLFPDPRRLTILLLRHNVEWLHKTDKNFFKRIKVNREKILEILAKPDEINDEKFEIVKRVQKRIATYKNKMDHISPKDLDTLVENERKRHINKRFNVSEKWLPLY